MVLINDEIKLVVEMLWSAYNKCYVDILRINGSEKRLPTKYYMTKRNTTNQQETTVYIFK